MRMKYIRQSWIRRLISRWTLRRYRSRMSSMSLLSTGGGIPIRQTKLAPDGVEFSEDVSEARWVEERLSAFGTLRSLLPEGFAAYARIFHPAYPNRDEERPVRWSTVASWTGRTVHPLMQFERITGLSEDTHDMYKDPPWGSLPKDGSIPKGSVVPWSRLSRAARRCTTAVSTSSDYVRVMDQRLCQWLLCQANS